MRVRSHGGCPAMPAPRRGGPPWWGQSQQRESIIGVIALPNLMVPLGWHVGSQTGWCQRSPRSVLERSLRGVVCVLVVVCFILLWSARVLCVSVCARACMFACVCVCVCVFVCVRLSLLGYACVGCVQLVPSLFSRPRAFPPLALPPRRAAHSRSAPRRGAPLPPPSTPTLPAIAHHPARATDSVSMAHGAASVINKKKEKRRRKQGGASTARGTAVADRSPPTQLPELDCPQIVTTLPSNRPPCTHTLTAHTGRSS